MNPLEARWHALPKDFSKSVFQLYDARHALDFYLGNDVQGRRLLLLVSSERPPAMQDLRMIEVGIFRREDGKWSLLLTLNDESLFSVFSMLCNDLIESSRAKVNKSESLKFVLKRLASWRRLLSRGNPAILSEGEVRGLCGELFFFQQLLQTRSHYSVAKSWVGPLKAAQDFQFLDIAWEIKTIHPMAKSVLIASELQLDSQDRPIQLLTVELVEAALSQNGAFTLNSLVENIRSILALDFSSAELFDERLDIVGYAPWPEYDSHVFSVRSLSAYSVDQDFPHITSKMLPNGINRVSYELSLMSCKNFLVNLEDFLLQGEP